MPTTHSTSTSNTHTCNNIDADLPPPYSPHNLPTLPHPPLADRGNYAFAIMRHDLTFNANTNTPETTPPSSPGPGPDPGRPPSPTPAPRPTNPKPDIPRTSRAQRAALRDYHATQNPEMWGRRVGHGRQARLIQDENQGFWAWLGRLFVDEDRQRALVMSAGSPWGLMGPQNYT